MAVNKFIAPVVFILGLIMGTACSLGSKVGSIRTTTAPSDCRAARTVLWQVRRSSVCQCRTRSTYRLSLVEPRCILQIVYQVKAVGLDGKHGFFEKPMMMTLIMFAAMVLAFPLHYIDHYYRLYLWRRATDSKGAPLSTQQHIGARSVSASQGASAPLLGSNGGGGSSRQHVVSSDSSLSLLQSSSDAPKRPEHPTWASFALLVVPAVLDLLATALASIGLLYVTVSLYQLSKCCVSR